MLHFSNSRLYEEERIRNGYFSLPRKGKKHQSETEASPKLPVGTDRTTEENGTPVPLFQKE